MLEGLRYVPLCMLEVVEGVLYLGARGYGLYVALMLEGVLSTHVGGFRASSSAETIMLIRANLGFALRNLFLDICKAGKLNTRTLVNAARR